VRADPQIMPSEDSITLKGRTFSTFLRKRCPVMSMAGGQVTVSPTNHFLIFQYNTWLVPGQVPCE